MHALAKYIGEDSINHALKHFLEKYGFTGPPYPTTYDLLTCLRACTPDSMQYFLTDCFQNITMYDNKVKNATDTLLNGKYQVDMTLDCNKYYADSVGKETLAPMNDFVDVGIFKEKGKVLQMNRIRLKNGENKLHFTVDEKPYKVMIDPHYLLIDKKPDDNEYRFGVVRDKVGL